MGRKKSALGGKIIELGGKITSCVSNNVFGRSFFYFGGNVLIGHLEGRLLISGFFWDNFRPVLAFLLNFWRVCPYFSSVAILSIGLDFFVIFGLFD